MDRVLGTLSLEHDLELERTEPEPRQSWDGLLCLIALEVVIAVALVVVYALLVGWTPWWVR